jgi:hypothetical protein
VRGVLPFGAIVIMGFVGFRVGFMGYVGDKRV